MSLADQLVVVAVESGLTSADVRRSESCRLTLVGAAGLVDRHISATVWREVCEQVDAANRSAARGRPSDAGTCSTCGQHVRWVQTEAGKSMPLNPLPHAGGNVVLVNVGRSALVARVLSRTSLPVTGRPAYRPHWSTCPDSDELRHRRRIPMATDPVCVICKTRLHPLLVAAGETSHVTCQEGL